MPAISVFVVFSVIRYSFFTIGEVMGGYNDDASVHNANLLVSSNLKGVSIVLLSWPPMLIDCQSASPIL